jgi:hypothetical protein
MRFPRIRPFGFRFYTTEPNSFLNLPDRSNGSSEWFGHWTFTQRTIHVVLPNKTEVLRHDRPTPTGTPGDLIRVRRKEAALTWEQLSKTTGIPIYWLGRWERDRRFQTRPNGGNFRDFGISRFTDLNNVG